MPLSQIMTVRLRGLMFAIVVRQPSSIKIEPSPSNDDDAALRLCQRDAERDRTGQSHATEHIKVLRPMAGGEQIEVAVADPADDGLVVAELLDQKPGQRRTVERVDRLSFVAHHGNPQIFSLALAAGLPPVRSGERMKATGACVA